MNLIRRFCPVYDFKPQIRIANPQRLSASLYGIRSPRTVTEVPEPIYVEVGEMSRRTREDAVPRRASLSIVSGLVVPEFSIVFSNPQRQWKSVSGSGANAQWQFQGGDVYSHVDLSLYVLRMYRPEPGNSCGERIFAVIMNHELEHIADEVDIVTNWLAPRAYREDVVERYLTNAEPMLERTYRHWFGSPAFTDWIKNGLWAPEHNRRAGIRDAPAEYRRVQDQIDTLRAQQINRGNCP